MVPEERVVRKYKGSKEDGCDGQGESLVFGSSGWKKRFRDAGCAKVSVEILECCKMLIVFRVE